MTRRLNAVLALIALLAVGAPAVSRANTVMGPHLGFSASPGQVLFGGQVEFADVAPQLDFVPGIDLGVGDNVTVISFNGDFHYRIPVQSSPWKPYAGAGISLHTYSGGSGDVHSSGAVGGGSLIVGADVPTKSDSRFFAEAKFGLGDGPSFKMIVGWHFKLRS